MLPTQKVKISHHNSQIAFGVFSRESNFISRTINYCHLVEYTMLTGTRALKSYLPFTALSLIYDLYNHLHEMKAETTQ